jgi:hypothetical protein
MHRIELQVILKLTQEGSLTSDVLQLQAQT